MELSVFQYSLIANLMSFTVAAMGASAIFFFLSRAQVAPKYRPALLLSGLVVAIACYHYVRIYSSFTGAWAFEGGEYVASGVAFNDAFRYADWLLTVPLLVIELVAVLALEKRFARSLMTRLGVAAVLMIALGFPGEVAEGVGSAVFWWIAAMLPFLYIVRTLYTEFAGAVDRQPENVKPLVEKARLLTVASWAFYPVAYLGGLGAGAAGETLLQIGYTTADLTAKVGLGLFIYAIARAKSEADGYVETDATPAAHPVAASVAASADQRIAS